MNFYTKEQAIGYMILAAKKMKLAPEEIKELIFRMEYEMETWTEEWAEQIYEKSF